MQLDYTRATKLANQLLAKYNCNKLPINIKKLISSFTNVKICSYSRFAKLHKISTEQVTIFFQSELGACVHDVRTDNYLFFYNDSKGEKISRFTLGHELGHYVLEHHKIAEIQKLSGGEAISEIEKYLDKEANCFSRNLLLPLNLLSLTIKSTDAISRACFVSKKAADMRISFLSTDLYNLNSSQTYEITRPFIAIPYLIEKPLKPFCKTCGSVLLQHYSFCPVCGQQNKTVIIGEAYMKYPKFDSTPSGNLKKCFICGNEETETGSHCIICGHKIKNYCSNTKEMGFNGPIYGDCGISLETNARFCPECGCKSSFFQKGILKPYNEVLREIMEDDNNPDNTEAAYYYNLYKEKHPLFNGDDDNEGALPFF